MTDNKQQLKPNGKWQSLPLFDRTEWKTVRLEEVCEEVSERVDKPAEAGYDRFIGLEHMDSGELMVRRWGSTEDLISSMKLFRKGDTLFARRNAYLRRASMVDFDGLCSGDAIVLREKKGKLEPGFLPLILNTDRWWTYAIANAAGSMSKRVNVRSLLAYEFALPPLDQQRRIADLLWAVDEVIVTAKAVQEKCAQVVKSLFGPSLAHHPRHRLDEVVDFLDGKRVPLSEKIRATRQGPYPYYGASGVIDNVDDFLFDEPLVLLSEDGFNLVNRTSRIAFKIEGKTWVNNHAHVLRPRSEVNIDYLSDYLESISLDEYITGTYQRKLNKATCEAIPIPIPPRHEQDIIADRIEALNQVVKRCDEHIRLSQELTQRILSQYF